MWRNRYELLAVSLITGVGAFLRLYRLDSIPAGIHGDEAWMPLRASAIRAREWAGPYDPYTGAGHPAGLEFWMAATVALFGDGVYAIRLSMALLAIAAIPLAYLLFRAIDGRATAIIGSSFLALSGWHLLFSRLAWPVVVGTTVELLGALVLLATLRFRRLWLFPVAGVVLALGVYVYNAHWYFLFGVAIVLAGWLFAQRRALRRSALAVAMLATGFLLAAWPLFAFIREHEDIYVGYARRTSIFNSTRFEEATGLLQKIDVVLDTGRDFLRVMVFDGASGVPMLAAATSVLLGLGVLYALRRWREPGIALGVILVFLIPWAAILSPSGPIIMVRRAVGVTPFIALVAALPLAAALRSKYLAAPPARALALAAAVGAVVSVGISDVPYYFGGYADGVHSNVNVQMVQASRYMADLPAESYVYFYSKRWPFDYVLRRYLAPDAQGEDRSGLWRSQFKLAPDREGDLVYVFLDSFTDRADAVERLYPGGRAIESTDGNGDVLFRAYELPATAPVVRYVSEATATASEASAGESGRQVTAAEEEDGSSPAERDRERREDLEQLRLALADYARRNGAYPDTGGNRQTLCVYRKADAGCALKSVLEELPQDPLGSSTTNGYWYMSDGSSFTLIALREEEEEGGQSCPEAVLGWAGGEPRYCVQGALP